MTLRSAVSFLTPLGGVSAPGPRTLDWFWLVGAGLGAAVGGIWLGAAHAWPRPLAAGVAVAADLALTGMLHFDGLLDSADGLLPPVSRARRLEIMSGPDVGAFAVGTGGAALLLRWAALWVLRPTVLLVAGLWCLSRSAMAFAARTQPYARDPEGGGLASAFAGRSRALPAVVGVAVAFGAACAWRPLAGAVSVIAAALAAGGVVVLARRRLGGYTGDVLGACGFMAETIGLLVAAARW
ncbi:MAG TPA: adenosylcobinamide-GDP ribazoletransferase [Acidimicrobiales bacterium]|nr:adenosylcobinamide-GDP ribazoletransferase [Acidimicrobiales bacterium]